MQFLNRKPYYLLVGATLVYIGFITTLLYVLLCCKTVDYKSVNIRIDNLHKQNEFWTGDLYAEDSINFTERKQVMKIKSNGEEHFINFEILKGHSQFLKIKISDSSPKMINHYTVLEGTIFKRKASEKVILSDLLSY
ncbi:hypothetical protein [Galbibacter pacificus]|uniref:Uncharacterized protein n=1 Tax=Galbibacter pacificus TaxID=2996052 RepID=A0ABT6FRV5_9FLAO|nr:hypothetical protein [Galbibacter pacificus]MDG3582879.1 hypothetical protein [Galbibacter pacificus]MDG3586002.1 hypothetical protein [Galbibacter pacificus]